MLWCDEKTACDYKRRIKRMVLDEQYGFLLVVYYLLLKLFGELCLCGNWE